MPLIVNYESGYDSDSPIGDLGADEYNLAQSFVTPASLNDVYLVEVSLKKVGTITDPVTVRIETSAAGPKPSGTLAHANATTTVTPSSTSYSWMQASFTPFALSPNTKYWIVCTVPAGQSTNNRYDWQRDQSPGGDGAIGQSIQVNLGTWSNEAADDCFFRVYDIEPGMEGVYSKNPASIQQLKFYNTKIGNI